VSVLAFEENLLEILSAKRLGAPPHNAEDTLCDIRKIRSDEIPDHQVLLAGFPCQSFSIAGVSKKNSPGMPHGFRDPTQGTLFSVVKRHGAGTVI